MKQTFQGIPVNFPPPTVSVVTGEGAVSSAMAGTYWFWLQGRNRQGFNQLSSSAIATVTVNSKINVTIPATCRPANDGSDIREILILASKVNDPATAVNLASVLAEALPVVVAIAADDHLVMGLAQVVTEEADLPSDRLRGMRRQLDDWDEIREWSGSAWVRCEPQLFSTAIDSIDGEYGARQSISLVQSAMAQPVHYGVDGEDSGTITYWLINNTSVAVPASTGIACTVESGGKDISGLINNGALRMAFAGYANTTSAARDLVNAEETGDMPAVDEWLDYPGPFTGLVLPKDLVPGAAYALSLKLNMSEAIAKFAAYDGQLVGFRLSLEPYTAHLVPMGVFLGSLIGSDAGRRRLVPGGTGLMLLGLPGTGVLKIGQSQAYMFRERPAQVVVGLASNTAGQQIYISAQGNLFIASVPGATSALRAVVGTLNGFSRPVAAGSVNLDSTFRLTVSVPIPSIIRADYPDTIASSPEGTFNASSIRAYARPVAGGNVFYWDAPIPLDQETVSLSFSAPGADLGSSAIAPVAADFGLYAPTGADADRVAGASTFPSGAYEIWVSFYFLDTVTSISHSTTLGCIPEADGGIAEIFEVLQYIAPPVYQIGHLRGIPPGHRRPLRQVFCAIAQGNYRWNPVISTSEDIDYAFRSAAGVPESGELALNNVLPSLVTEIRFHSLDRDGDQSIDITEQIALDEEIRLDTETSGDTWATFRAASAAVLDGGVYSLQVIYLSGAGAFVEDALVVLSVGNRFVRPFDVPRAESGRWVPEVAAVGGSGGASLAAWDKVLVIDGDVVTIDDNVVYLE